MHMRILSAFLIFSVLPALVRAQDIQAVPFPTSHAAVTPDEGSYLVTFHARSFDLEPYAEAIRSRRPAAEVEAIVASMDAMTRADQASFVETVERLGGQVLNQWWIINGACVRISPEGMTTLQTMPNVASVHENPVYTTSLTTATNAQHHNSDLANTRIARGSSGAVRGTGISIAILDTGIDANMGGTGRPHRSFFVGGNPSNMSGGGIGGSLIRAALSTSGFAAEDANGHGTFSSACAAANRWSTSTSVDDGPAPGAFLVSIKMSNDQGTGLGNWIIDAWQRVAALRATYDIRVANNSFSGSPMLSDPVQTALDNTALAADVLITCSAGNLGSNTTNSQSVFNGLAVGSINKNTLAVSSFSGRGPLSGTNRTYPDIVAVGANVLATLRDSESSVAQQSGTSFSSPIVAGIAALVRQADPAISALETKAILLNTTNVTNSNRNQYGLGIARADRAVDAALSSDFQTHRISSPTRVANIPFPCTQGVARTVTITWMRGNNQVPHNLDLRIFAPDNSLVGQDLSPSNSYEKVSFTPGVTGTYRAEITWANNVIGNVSVDFAIAGAGGGCTGNPTLSAAVPSTTSNHNPAQITLTGTNLNNVQRVDFGALQITQVTQISPTEVRFTPPNPAPIGAIPVTIISSCGVSAPITLNITGTHPAVLDGPIVALRSDTTPATYRIFGDLQWQSMVLLSFQATPSVIPGLVNLGLGASFTDLHVLGTVPHDATGTARLDLFYGLTLPAPFGVFLQAVTYDPLNLVLPLEVTNVRATSIF